MLLWLLACLHKEAPPSPEAIRGEMVLEGGLSQRLSNEPADLVIVYGGEQKGSMDTCGCPKRPRGSLPRIGAYVAALERRKEPMILLNPGYWLEDAGGFEGELRPDVEAMDRWMIKGLSLLPWGAMNLGAPDLAALTRLGAPLPALPLVSANAKGAPGSQIFTINGIKVGVTGISGQVPTLSDPVYPIQDPMTAGPIIEELGKQVEVLVLLSWEATDAAKKLAERYPEIDVVIDANQYREFMAPAPIGHSVWVFSHYQTMRLGELRLKLDHGSIIGAVDRKIDMDPAMPAEDKLDTMLRQARGEIDLLQRQLYQ